MHFYLLFVVMLFSSTSYAYQCVSVEGAPFSQLHTMTDVVKGSSAMFSANKKKVWFYSYPNSSCKQKEIFIVRMDLVYVFAAYNGFYYVEYVSQKGKSVYGWVNEIDLAPYNNYSVSPGEKMSIADFSIYIDDRWISINTASDLLWDIPGRHEVLFVGSYKNTVGGLYKYYTHIYPFGEIVSSNFLYDKRMQNVDNGYRLTSILLSKHGYVTARGIGIGDTVSNVRYKYKSKDLLDDGSTLTYRLGNYFISYNIKDGVVSSINIGYEFPNQKY